MSHRTSLPPPPLGAAGRAPPLLGPAVCYLSAERGDVATAGFLREGTQPIGSARHLSSASFDVALKEP